MFDTILDKLEALLKGWSPTLFPISSTGKATHYTLHIFAAMRAFTKDGRIPVDRLNQLDQGLMPRLVLGVDRHLAKTKVIAPLLERPVFAPCGFLFSDIPGPRA